PVSFGAVRKVHTGFSSQPQQVLQWDDGCVRNGSEHGANEIPVNLFAFSVEIIQTKRALALDLFCGSRGALAGDAVEPTHRRIVVMCAGVSHDVRNVVVRQIDVLRVAAKTKLENSHAGKTKLLAQCNHVRCDDAEIFGDDRQLAERVTNRREQFPSRRFDPLTALSGLVAARYFPTRGETTKVVHTRDINHRQCRAHALDPPLETVGLHALPVVERVAPELASGAEVIRWNTRDDEWFSVLIQLELFRVGPNVSGVMGHKDRQIADNLDPVVVTVTLQSRPLPEEEKLVKHVCFDFFSEFLPLVVPFVPRDTTVCIFQSAEARVILQPTGLLLRERFKRGAQRSVSGLCVALVSFTQQLHFRLVDFPKIYFVFFCG